MEHEIEIVQEILEIGLSEQLQIIQTVKTYFNDYILPEAKLNPAWVSGYEMKSHINAAYGDEPVYKCNMEVFFQQKGTLQRKKVYNVSLIRFASEGWLVFQVNSSDG